MIDRIIKFFRGPINLGRNPTIKQGYGGNLPDEELPAWLWAFTTPRDSLKDPGRIAEALNAGKSVIMLCNNKPIRIQFVDNKVTVEEIENYKIRL